MVRYEGCLELLTLVADYLAQLPQPIRFIVKSITITEVDIGRHVIKAAICMVSGIAGVTNNELQKPFDPDLFPPQ